MSYKDPFLSLDELARERDNRLAQEQAGAAREFGQSVLNYQNLQKQKEERADRLARESRLDAEAKTRADTQAKREARQDAAADEEEQSKKLTDFVTARTQPHTYESPKTLPALPAQYTLPQTYPGAPLATEPAPFSSLANTYAPPGAGGKPGAPTPAKLPDAAQLAEDAAKTPGLKGVTPEQVATEYEKVGNARDKTAADLEFRKDQAARAAGAAAYQAAKLQNLPEEMALKKAHEAEAAERDRQGWARIDLAKDQEAGKNSRATQQIASREKLQGEKGLSNKGLETLTNVEAQQAGLDRIKAAHAAGQDTGPISNMIRSMRRSLHWQNPEDAQFKQEVEALNNVFINQFGGKALSAHELARVLPTLPNTADNDEVFDAMVNGLQDRLDDQHNAILKVESEEPKKGGLLEAHGGLRKNGKPVSPPATNGKVTVTSPSGAKVEVSAEQAAKLRAKGWQ